MLDRAGESARMRDGVAEAVKLINQMQPDGLAGIVGVRAAQPVSAADGHISRAYRSTSVPDLLLTPVASYRSCHPSRPRRYDAQIILDASASHAIHHS